MRYWDGQPVYFVCCERSADPTTETGRPLGRVFWCIAIEVLEGEAAEDNEERPEDQVSENDPHANAAVDDVD